MAGESQNFAVLFTTTYEGAGADAFVANVAKVQQATEAANESMARATPVITDYATAQTDAAAAAEKLAAAQAAAAGRGTSGLATAAPDLSAQTAAQNELLSAEARRNELLQERRVIGEILLEQMEAEAAGEAKTAGALAEELAIRTEGYKIAVAQNVTIEEGIALAERKVAAEGAIAETAAAQEALNAELIAQEAEKLALMKEQEASQSQLATFAARGLLRGAGAGLGHAGIAAGLGPLALMIGLMEGVRLAREKWTESEKKGQHELDNGAKAYKAELAEMQKETEQTMKANTAAAEGFVKMIDGLTEHADKARAAIAAVADAKLGLDRAQIDEQAQHGALTEGQAIAAKAKAEAEAKIQGLQDQIAVDHAKMAEDAYGYEDAEKKRAAYLADATSKNQQAQDARDAQRDLPDIDQQIKKHEDYLIHYRNRKSYTDADGKNPYDEATNELRDLKERRRKIQEDADQAPILEKQAQASAEAASDMAKAKDSFIAKLNELVSGVNAAEIKIQTAATEGRIGESKGEKTDADRRRKDEADNEAEYARLTKEAQQKQTQFSDFGNSIQDELSNADGKDAAARAKDREKRAKAKDDKYRKRFHRDPVHPTDPDSLKDEDDDPGSNTAGKAYGQHKSGDDKAAADKMKTAGTHVDNAAKATKDVAEKIIKYATQNHEGFDQVLKHLEDTGAITKDMVAIIKQLVADNKELKQQVANIRSSMG